MRKRLSIIGIFLAVVGLGFLAGSGYSYMRIQDGYDSLQAFSAQQDVQLSYNEDGQLIDRGTVEGAEAILALLEDDWSYPVVKGDLDPGDPLVNTATEYMYQMATIVYHTGHGTQTIVVDQAMIDAGIDSGALEADGTYNGVVEEYAGEVIEPGGYDVAIDGRYWTGFDRTDFFDGPAREAAWSGTVHGLVGELGVGTVTHSTLQMGLGLAVLLAGLGMVFLVTGGGLVWAARAIKEEQKQVPDTVPTWMTEEHAEGTEAETTEATELKA